MNITVKRYSIWENFFTVIAETHGAKIVEDSCSFNEIRNLIIPLVEDGLLHDCTFSDVIDRLIECEIVTKEMIEHWYKDNCEEDISA
jgi:hypothetical protein